MRISRLLSPSSFEYYTISSLQRYIQNKEGFVAIENLDRFINVKVLYLENNCISKIEGLSKLKFLTCLYLHNNFISDIENLDECTELHTLNLASNKIKKIQNLGRLKKLENLYLDKNLIENYDSICDILECPSITVLELSNNNIEAVSQEFVEVFYKMQNLKVLYLKGNEGIRNISNYRRNMIAHIKNLTYLDDRPVKPIDRVGAEAYMEGGAQAEIEARRKYSQENDFVKRVREDEKFELTYEERKAKAINNMRNEYESKKERLETQKRYLVKEIEKYPDNMAMKMKLSWEVHSLDYQLKENEKYYKIEQQDVIGSIIKREKLDINSVFEFEDWMFPIIERNVIENFFHFERALRLIKNELRFNNFKNYDLLTEYDLRTKWTEMELKKYRSKEEKFFYDERIPIQNAPVEDKSVVVNNTPKLPEQANYTQGTKNIINNNTKLGEKEEMINTKVDEKNEEKSSNNRNIYDDINNDDIISLPKSAHEKNIKAKIKFEELD